MDEQFYLMRFVAHRKTFALDMTDGERAIMAEHLAYWAGRVREGRVLLFGPVIDERESWGFAVVQSRSKEAAVALTEKDPAKGLGRYEMLPIPRLIRADR